MAKKKKKQVKKGNKYFMFSKAGNKKADSEKKGY